MMWSCFYIKPLKDKMQLTNRFSIVRHTIALYNISNIYLLVRVIEFKKVNFEKLPKILPKFL